VNNGGGDGTGCFEYSEVHEYETNKIQKEKRFDQRESERLGCSSKIKPMLQAE